MDISHSSRQCSPHTHTVHKKQLPCCLKRHRTQLWLPNRPHLNPVWRARECTRVVGVLHTHLWHQLAQSTTDCRVAEVWPEGHWLGSHAVPSTFEVKCSRRTLWATAVGKLLLTDHRPHKQSSCFGNFIFFSGVFEMLIKLTLSVFL